MAADTESLNAGVAAGVALHAVAQARAAGQRATGTSGHGKILVSEGLQGSTPPWPGGRGSDRVACPRARRDQEAVRETQLQRRREAYRCPHHRRPRCRGPAGVTLEFAFAAGELRFQPAVSSPGCDPGRDRRGDVSGTASDMIRCLVIIEAFDRKALRSPVIEVALLVLHAAGAGGRSALGRWSAPAWPSHWTCGGSVRPARRASTATASTMPFPGFLEQSGRWSASRSCWRHR